MSAKLISGVIIGAGAALAIGYLMTDEGSEIRKSIKDFLSSSLDKGKEIVKEYSENTGEKVSAAKEA